MLKFGKKVNYRPMLVGALIGLIPGLAANDLLNSAFKGVIAFLIFFFLILLSYYLFTLPVLFSYWEVDQKQIRYSNMDSKWHRLAMMLIPQTNHLTAINMQDIASVKINGTYDRPKTMPFALPFTPYMGAIYAIMSMANNPLYLTLTLKNGQKRELSMARDYTYDSKKAFEKIDQLSEILDKNSIRVNNHMKSVSADGKVGTW